ncbi:MAG: ThuA domain-containing protein, partial [Verrucomicrobia bacterium]|nr:ThuA domain-containing protein [Verrucomicrobiota bacterium]
FYYLNSEHEITAGCSNFDLDDELYWDLHMMPEANILASTWIPDRRNTKEGRAYPHIYETAPQMWTYERTLEGGVPYRAFVSIPGHKFPSFQMPHYRAVLLRGIAWSAHRPVDSLCRPEELASLRYPEGGPTAPGRASQKLEVHPEFTIDLVASEPLITKPIAIDWDPQGRLWIAETPEYPNGRRGIRPNMAGQEWKDHGGLVSRSGIQDRPARDRISILSDSNGDGKMDKKDVWFEGLELVTGFVFYRDGVIASAAPDIFWIRDRDHDGKADEVVKLYSGLGNGDTHAVINNLRWGMDGWIYATHGYSAGDVKSPDGSKTFGRIGSGVVRFRPDGSAFEQYSSKGGNTWGLDFSWDGDLFFTQPTSGDLLMTVLMPENVLSRVAGAKVPSYQVVIRSPKSYPLMKSEQMAYVQIDWVGSFTAAAGAAIYGGGSWPSAYNGHYFTTEPTINIIHHESIAKSGSGYQGSKLRTEEFIGSHDLWFRPIETRIGPDGALYLLDFYNQAVIHNDTRGPAHNNVNAAVRPDRDHYFGRVWRVNHRDARRLPAASLAAGQAAEWVAALEHPNRAVRMNAHRLLTENPAPQIAALAGDPQLANAATRIHALWLAEQAGSLAEESLISALRNPEDGVRKTGLRIVAQRADGKASSPALQAAVSEAAAQGSPAVRLQALIALSQMNAGASIAKDLVAMYPSLSDPWLEAAAQGAAASKPVAVLKAALEAPRPDGLSRLVSAMGALVATSGKPEGFADLITAVGAPGGHPALQRVVLESLATAGKSTPAPPWTDAVQQALTRLLASDDAGLRLAALPLISRWDTGGSLATAVNRSAVELLARLRDSRQSEVFRKQAISGLLSVRQSSTDILPAVLGVLGSQDSAALQSHALKALSDLNDPSVTRDVVNKFATLPAALQSEAFDQLLKRSDSSMALLEALASGKAPATALGPANMHRLRYHPDAEVAKRAAVVIEQIRGPEAKEKQSLIARLTPEVTQAGDAKAGHQLFTQNCAGCHRFNDEGKDVGPTLTGMGAHGAAELLVHILDPNREVDPSFAAWNFETNDGENYDGVIGRENRASVFIKSAAGEMELKRDQIRSQRNTGRSLMPEGFEALGAAGLRNLLSFITAGDAHYRVLDLRGAFTADSSKGIYNSVNQTGESLHFKRFGMIQAGAVPFEVVSPARGPGGKNLIVLKGGFGFAKTLPAKVEIPAAGVTADRLHFLGGVAGWGYPCCGENQGLPAAKVTVAFADGQREEWVLKNGQEIADYNGMSEVPGSALVKDLVPQGTQVRWFTKRLKKKGELAKVTIESFDNAVAPTFVALTAEAGDPSQPTTADARAAAMEWGAGIRTLLVGGGSSHDFNRWFNLADVATLKASPGIAVNYTEKYNDVIPALKQIDVLGWSANQAQKDPELRKALLDYADSGKGLVLIHPGNWYIWNDWPEWNKILVGGGAKSHDRYGEFEVSVTARNHPLMGGVPATFRLSDELYHMEVDPEATPIEVLATGKNLTTGKSYPLVWVTKHPRARIVNITLGHDGDSHDHPAYKQLLRNAVTWASKKPLTASN